MQSEVFYCPANTQHKDSRGEWGHVASKAETARMPRSPGDWGVTRKYASDGCSTNGTPASAVHDGAGVKRVRCRRGVYRIHP